MNVPDDSELYQVIGLAVIASQQFEAAFIMAARMALKQADVEALEEIVPITSLERSLRQPVKALLNELGKEARIDPTLQGRVEALVEKRHTIIHRQVLYKGWPWPGDPARRASFFELCTEVTSESCALADEFVRILFSWANKFPQLRELTEEQCRLVPALSAIMSEHNGA